MRTTLWRMVALCLLCGLLQRRLVAGRQMGADRGASKGASKGRKKDPPCNTMQHHATPCNPALPTPPLGPS
jgi:hypothetical protein